MKVSVSFATAVFATGALSHAVNAPSKVARDPPSFVERDVATITEVLNSVGSGIEELDSAVQAFAGEAEPLEEAAQALVSTIQEGVTTVDASEDLTLEDALALQGPVGDLTDQAEALVDNLVAQREAIAEAGFCSNTRTQVSDIQTNSQTLIDSVVSKVPEAAQGIAEGLAADLVAVLERATEEFNEENCVDAEQPEPTGEPTPTDEPTAEPTEEPTGEPTEEPTAEPTEEPTGPAPTDGPSTSEPAPTDIPTITTSPTEPTGVPTNGTTSLAPIPTGGAGVLAPAGALVFGLAAMLV